MTTGYGEGFYFSILHARTYYIYVPKSDFFIFDEENLVLKS